MATRGATGREVEAIFGHASTGWGTATDLDSTTSGFWALEHGVARTVENLADDSAGFAWNKQVDQGNESVTGGPSIYYRYDNDPTILMIAKAMGGYAYTLRGANPTYEHAMTLTGNLTGKYGTLAYKYMVDDAADIWEVPSFKVGGFTLEGSEGGLVTITPIGIGSKMVRTNLVNSFTSITYNGIASRIPFSKLKFVIGGTQVYPNSFTFTFNRNIGTNFVAHEDLGSKEMEGEGQPEITFSIGQPQYGHDGVGTQLPVAWYSDTDLAITVTYAGTELDTGFWEGFQLSMPVTHILTALPQFSGPGRVPHTIDFQVLQGAGLPFTLTGWSDTVTDLGL